MVNQRDTQRGYTWWYGVKRDGGSLKAGQASKRKPMLETWKKGFGQIMVMMEKFKIILRFRKENENFCMSPMMLMRELRKKPGSWKWLKSLEMKIYDSMQNRRAENESKPGGNYLQEVVRSDNWNPCGGWFGKAKREYQGGEVTWNRRLQSWNYTIKNWKESSILRFYWCGLMKSLHCAVQIQKMVDKSKRLVNIMRCLVGREWGAVRRALKSM